MIQPARAAKVAEWHALVAVIARSQILLPKPLPRTPIPYEDEVDIAILAWIASHVRGVCRPIGSGASIVLETTRRQSRGSHRGGRPRRPARQ
jgi:hypothetical protein